MAERNLITKIVVTGEDIAIEKLTRLTAALRDASEAKKEFDSLFGNASNSMENQSSSSSAPQ